jgi:hypothetical protein
MWALTCRPLSRSGQVQSRTHKRGKWPIIAALFDDVHFPKPESLYDGVGVTHVLSAVQNHTDVTAMHADPTCERSLTPLTFKRRFKQNKRVFIIEYVRLLAQILREDIPVSRFFGSLFAVLFHELAL